MANETASRRSEFYLASLMPADRWRVEMLPCLSDASGISEAAFQMDSDLEGRTGPRLNIGLFSAHPHPPAELKRQECLAKARETTSKVETNWGHLSESITPSPNSEVVSLARLLTKKAPENEGGGPVVEDNETVQSVKLPAVQEKSDGVSPVVSAPQTGPTVPNGAETSVKAEASSSVTGYYCHVMSLARPATQRFWQERFSDVDISSAQSKTRVIKVLVRGKRWYRIGLGPYETQIEAQAVCEQIPARISPDPVTTSQAEFLSSQ